MTFFQLFGTVLGEILALHAVNLMRLPRIAPTERRQSWHRAVRTLNVSGVIAVWAFCGLELWGYLTDGTELGGVALMMGELSRLVLVATAAILAIETVRTFHFVLRHAQQRWATH